MSDIKYNRIDEDLQQKIISNRESHWINPYAFKDEMAVRRNNDIDKPIYGVPCLFVMWKKLCICHTITDMLIKHRCFRLKIMTILHEEHSMSNSFQELHEILAQS